MALVNEQRADEVAGTPRYQHAARALEQLAGLVHDATIAVDHVAEDGTRLTEPLPDGDGSWRACHHPD